MHELDRLADDRVLDVLDIGDALELRILDEVLRLEGLVQRDVDVLVDGRRDEEAAVFAIV